MVSGRSGYRFDQSGGASRPVGRMSRKESAVGGAERSERKRKQQAVHTAGTSSVVGERGTGGGMRPGVVVTVLLVLVIGFGVWLHYRNEPDLPAAIPAA